MTSLKQLRTRIKSISSTKKITGAMKMVAASKLRRAQESALKGLPYALEVQKLVEKAISYGDLGRLPKIIEGSINAPVLVIMFAADRGLCGGFNTTMFKKFRDFVSSYKEQKRNFYCMGIGQKSIAFLKKNYENHLLEDFILQEGFNADCALKIARKIGQKIEMGEIGGVEIIYTHFKNVITLRPTQSTLVPIKHEKKTHTSNTDMNVPLFEPSINLMLNDLLHLFFASQLFTAYLQSQASEHASRMTAMDNATRNAHDIVEGLRLKYNRTRQAIITKELIEIISGAETSSVA
jgi:F-type H+-transporting ATPase subunit gamma